MIGLLKPWVGHRIENAALRRRNRPLTQAPQTYQEAMLQRMALLLRALTPQPSEMVVQEIERLDPLDTEHGTWRIALEGGGTPRFTPGDMVYLRWQSDPREVENLLQRLKAAGDRPVRLLTAGSRYLPSRLVSITLREALTRYVEIQEASPALLRRAGLEEMAAHNEAEEEKHHQFHEEIEQSGVAWHEHPDLNPYRVYVPAVLDTMEPSPPSPKELVALQGRIDARPYTISSFQSLPGDRFRAEITVSQVDKTLTRPDGSRIEIPARGSTYFSRLEPGDTVYGWILPEMHRFPCDLGRNVPTIVVSTGSGISAPLSLLRSELVAGDEGSRKADGRHHRAGAESGPIWLVYGIRSWERKSLYGKELERLRREGAIARLDVAESRPAPGTKPPRRVQNLLWEERAEVAHWLREGAHIYLSGRLSMGREVGYVLADILMDQGLAADRAAADATIEEWAKSLRLQASVSGV